MTEREATEATTPAADMLRLIAGFRISRTLYIAARLGLADLLCAAPQDSAALASATGTHAPSLHRILRALASIGAITEDAEHRFALTPLGATLQSDVADSLRAWAMFSLGDEHYEAWGQLMHSVRTGETAFDHVFGTDVWRYRAAHAEHAAIFDKAMGQRARGFHSSLVAAYPFGEIERLVDVGGGDATLLVAVLGANPGMTGVLFDLPQVANRAGERIAGAGLAKRCAIVAGNIFEDVLPGADGYLLSRVIHDWDDEAAVAILTSCRNAMSTGGRVLLVERVLSSFSVASPEAQASALSDLTMMVMNGGRERTEAEYRALLERAGLVPTTMIPIESGTSVIEARRRA